MKCPECGKEVKGKSCSYCNYILEDEKIVYSDEEIKEYKKNRLFIILAISVSLVLAITINFWVWTVILSVVTFVFIFYLLIKKLKKNKLFTKKMFYSYIFIIVVAIFLTLVPAVREIDIQISMYRASDKYSEMLDIVLPDQKADDYVYISNTNIGTRCEMFTFELNDEEISELYHSGYFKSTEKADRIYNIFMNSIGNDYDTNNLWYMVYDKLGDRFDYITDLDMYDYVIVVISEENTVFVCELFRAEPEV